MDISNGASPQLIKNIFATLAYYDGMDYPMTAFEVCKYLMIWNYESGITNYGHSLADIINSLDDYELRKFIEEYRGFYFLRGRKELVKKRIDRNKIAVGKLKRLRRVVWFLRFIPFVRMIGVTGRLAMKYAEKESDWDVLVVLKSGKIWTGRTLITGFLHLIGKRRYGEKIKDRICLNHFITDKSLEIITKEIEPLFPANEFSFILPLFDAGVFRKFQLKNSWIKNYKPNYCITGTNNLKLLEDGGISRIVRKIGERIFDFNFLENWLKSWQQEKIAENPKTDLPGSFIRTSDEHLVFLPQPQGPELAGEFRSKLEA